MQLRFALMPFIQCQKFIIDPERINENVVDPSDLLFCSKHVPFPAGIDGGIGTQGVDQVGFVFDLGIDHGIAHAGAKPFMGIAAADPGFMETLRQFGSRPVGFRLFTGIIGFDKIKTGNQIPRSLSAPGIHKA